MIRIVQIEGCACVKMFCDECEREIEGDGNYEWRVDRNGAVVTGDVFFTHKRCCWGFEDRRGGRAKWCAMEIKLFPVYLSYSLGVTGKKWQKAVEAACRMSEW